MNLLIQEIHLPVGLVRRKAPRNRVIQQRHAAHLSARRCSTTSPPKARSENQDNRFIDCRKSRRLISSPAMGCASRIEEVTALLLGLGILHLVAFLPSSVEPHQAALTERGGFAALSFEPPQATRI